MITMRAGNENYPRRASEGKRKGWKISETSLPACVSQISGEIGVFFAEWFAWCKVASRDEFGRQTIFLGGNVVIKWIMYGFLYFLESVNYKNEIFYY